MKYCSECGHKLASGIEKFCSECGQKLIPSEERPISIDHTSGDVLGTGVSGNKNIIGKEFAYAKEGHAIVININNPSSQEIVEVFKNIMAMTTQVEQASIISKEDIKRKIQELEVVHHQIKNIINEVNRIRKDTGTKIQEIKAGDLQISTNELSLKEVILKGNEHYYKQEYKEAMKWYDKAIQLDPGNASAWNNKGNIFNEQGKYHQAILYFDKAIAIDAGNASALSNKAAALNYLKKYDEAILYFDKAIDINPSDVSTLSNKAAALNNLGNYQEAIKCCDKAIEIDEQISKAYSTKAYALAHIQKYDEAIKYSHKAIELNPDDADAWSMTGGILNDSNLGKYEEAIKYFNKAIELNPHDIHAWNNKGYALGNLYSHGDVSKYDEAIKCFDKAIELKHPLARSNKNYLINKKAQIEMPK